MWWTITKSRGPTGRSNYLIMCSNGILTVECRSIPSVDTLNRPLDRYSMNTPLTTQLTLYWHSINISVNSWSRGDSVFDQFIWVSQHSADYPPTVDIVSTKYRSGWQLGSDWWDVDQGYRSRVLIDTQLRMPLVQMIQIIHKCLTEQWIILFFLGKRKYCFVLQKSIKLVFKMLYSLTMSLLHSHWSLDHRREEKQNKFKCTFELNNPLIFSRLEKHQRRDIYNTT